MLCINKRKIPGLFVIFLLFLLSGCSLNYTEDTTGKGDAVNGEDYIPLAINSTWTKTSGLYGSSGRTTYTDSIEDTLSSGAKFYYVYKHGNGEETELWRLDSNIFYTSGYDETAKISENAKPGTGKISVEEKPYIVFGVAPGTSWPIASGTEISGGNEISWVMTGRYKGYEDVIGTSEAGPFPDCPKIEIIRKITTSPVGQPPTVREEIRTLWFAKSIGIVRESFETKFENRIEPAEVTSLLEWYIPKNANTFSMNGVVTDSTGSGVANVKFKLSLADTVSADSITYSGQRGAYTFKAVRKGQYRIVPELKGYIFKPDTLFAAVTNKPVTGLNFNAVLLPKKFIVSGAVIDEKGSALEGVSLTLSGGKSVITNESGLFGIPGVFEGDYWLTPYLDGYAFTPDSLNIKVLGGDISDISFTGTPGSFTVSGIITDDDNKPVENVSVYLDQTRVFITGASGFYTFTEVPNGRHEIVPVAEDWIFSPQKLEITVSGKDLAVNPIKGVLHRLYPLTGTILDDKGNPVPDVTLSVSDSVLAISGADGKYMFGLPAGSYTLLPSLMDYTFIPESINAVVSGPLENLDFTATPPIIIRHFSISGFVTDSDNNGVSDISVELDGIGTVTTGNDGSYIFKDIPPGDYTVRPSSAETLTFDPESRAVSVTDSDAVNNNFIAQRSSEAFSISGKVIDESGNAIENCQLSISSENGNQTTYSFQPDGSFIITGALPGEYRITPLQENWKFTPEAITVTITDSGVTGLEFTGTNQANFYTISGMITGSAGTGLANVTVSLSNGATASTGSDGSYSFQSIENGNYTVTPSLNLWNFSPSVRNVTVNGGDVSGVNFTGAEIPKTYSVYGAVKTGGGIGIPGVTVSLSNGSSVTTSQDGSYSLNGINNGSYTVSVSLAGYNFSPDSRNVDITDADAGNVDFTGSLTLVYYTISGTISAQGGDGIAGVSVSLSNGLSTATSQGGSYTFNGVSNGSYTISPSLDGYIFSPGSRNVSVNNADVQNADFTGAPIIIRTYLISGRITDEEGSGIEGVTVSLGSSTYVTGSNGDYLFTGLSNGTYSVSPTLDGWEFTPQSRQIGIGGADITDINFTGISLKPKVYNISGSAADEKGAGIEGVLIEVSSSVAAGGSPIGLVLFSAETGSDGSFSIPGIPNGNYSLTATKEDWTFPSSPASVEVKDSDLSGIRLTGTYTPPLFVISGTVMERETNKPLSDVTLSIFVGENERTTVSDTDGSYIFTDVPNGNYYITPQLEGYSFNPESAPVTVKDSDIINIKLTGEPDKYSVTGIVQHSEYGDPLAGVKIDVSNDAGLVIGTIYTDDSGAFEIQLNKGRYILRPALEGYRFEPEITEIEIYNQALKDVNLSGTPVTHKVIVKILDATGTMGIQGVALSLYSTLSDISFSAITDDSGTFIFEGISDGDYILKPSGAGMLFTPDSLNITVKSVDLSGITFTCQEFFSVSGKITDSAGNGIQSATVRLSGDTVTEIQTDSGGNYTFGGLRKGSYTITPSLSGYVISPASKNVTIGTENISGVNFTAIVPTFTISGKVLSNFGTGMSDILVFLSGNSTMSVKTDANGYYTFTGVPNGSWIVQPSSMNHTFSPSSSSVTVAGGNVTVGTFTGTAVVHHYYVTGKVVNSDNVGISDVVMTLTGGANTFTVSTGTGGVFSFPSVTSGTYTLTPSKAGNTFTPALRTITVNANVQDVNFSTSASGYTISGNVTFEGNGLGGVIVVLTPGQYSDVSKIASGSPIYTTTNGAGYYEFTGVSPGSYMIVPGKEGYVIAPVYRDVEVTVSNLTNINFTSTLPTYLIGGNIQFDGGLSGVTVTLSPGNSTTVTDADGNYWFTGLVPGAYTITPSKDDYGFSPPYTVVTITDDDYPSVNFSATHLEETTFSGTLRYSDSTPMWNEMVVIEGPGGYSNIAFTDEDGYYQITTNLPGNYAIIPPDHNGWIVSPSNHLVSTGSGDVTGLDFTYTRVYKIFGYVLQDSTGMPVGGVAIELSDSGETYLTSTTTNAAGYYEFTALADTTSYYVRAIDIPETAYFGGSEYTPIYGSDFQVNFTAYTDPQY